MVGMSGKRVLPESQLLNGYKGVPENDSKVRQSDKGLVQQPYSTTDNSL